MPDAEHSSKSNGNLNALIFLTYTGSVIQRIVFSAVVPMESTASKPSETAHQRILEEAKRVLSTRDAEKKLLLMQPAAPSTGTAAAAPVASRGNRVSSGSVFRRHGGANSNAALATAVAAAFHRGGAAAVNALFLEATDTLLSEEADGRLRMTAREVWEREVCCQHAAVEWINCVYRPLADHVVRLERDERSEIRVAEQQEFAKLTSAAESVEARLFETARSMELKQQARRIASAMVADVERDARPSTTPAGAARLTTAEPAERPPQSTWSASSRKEHSSTATKFGPDWSWGNSVETHVPAAPSAPKRPAPPARAARGSVNNAVAVDLQNPPKRPVLDLATAVHLHNQNVYFRRMIEEAEAEARADALQQFTVGLKDVDALVRRRQHLDRLVYWRNEREARRAVEAQLEVIQRAVEEVISSERVRRHEIEEDEEENAASLWTCEYLDYCSSQLHDSSREEMAARERVHADHSIETAVTLLPFFEGLQRGYIDAVQRHECEARLQVTARDIACLERFSRHIRSQCIVIQRFYRKRRLGLAGWRRTHQMIGTYIQQYRAAKRMEKNRSRLTAYKSQVEAQVAEELAALEAERIQEQRLFFAEERNARSEIETQDAWFTAGFRRRFQTELIHNIIMPRYRIICAEEDRSRDAISCLDEVRERDALVSFHAAMLKILEVKAIVQRTEALDRLRVEDLEADEHGELMSAAARGASLVAKRQEEHCMNQAEKRNELLEEMTLEFERDVSDAFLASIRRMHHQFKLGLVSVFALSERLSGRFNLRQEQEREYETLCEQFLFWQHAFFGRSLLNDSRYESIHFHRVHLFAVAGLQKHDHFQDAVHLLETLVWMEFCEGRNEIEAQIEQRHRASLAIQRFFRNYQIGKVGRTGMRAYLRVRFEEKRARAEIRRKMEEQRDVVERSRQELALEIAKHNLATVEEYNVFLLHLERDVEPRVRQAVETHHLFIFTIIKRNFEGCKADIIKSNLAEIVQQEAYFRTAIVLEWRSDYDARIAPKQRVFIKDVKIRPAQRQWRCHVARCERRRRADGLVDRLPWIEEKARRGLELEAFSAFTTEIEKPFMMIRTMELEYFGQLLSQSAMCDNLAFGPPLHEVVQQEWRERADIYWALQQTIRYRHIEAAETTNRRSLTTSLLDAGRQRAELFEEERVARIALDNERSLFLLRFLSLMESSVRVMVARSGRRDEMTLFVDIVEPFHRAYHQQCAFHELNWPMQHYETNQRIKILHLEDMLRKRLAFFVWEGEERMDKEDRLQSLCAWFLWLVAVQEQRQRVEWIEAAEVLERRELTLKCHEGVARFALWQEWLLQMAHPSIFSPRGVLRFSPPYLYVCERQEEDLRQQLLQEDVVQFWGELFAEKARVMARYINASPRFSHSGIGYI